MAQVRSFQAQIEIKSNADKFFDVYARKTHLIPSMSPNRYSKIELFEGNWTTVGSVQNWHYIFEHDNCGVVVKSRVEEINENNRSMTFNIIDGEIMRNFYKSFKSKIQVTPKAQGCSVKWSFEYEQMSEDAPEPKIIADFLLGVAKDIDACLCSSA